MNQLLLDKINALVQCDPARCAKAGCPLYYQEKDKCDADRAIDLLTMILKNKFNDVATYSIYEEQ